MYRFSSHFHIVTARSLNGSKANPCIASYDRYARYAETHVQMHYNKALGDIAMLLLLLLLLSCVEGLNVPRLGTRVLRTPATASVSRAACRQRPMLAATTPRHQRRLLNRLRNHSTLCAYYTTGGGGGGFDCAHVPKMT